MLISDEVYEHMVFDGVPHVSASSHPGRWLRGRFVVSSFGKTYHVTGWKVGYGGGTGGTLMAEFRKVHQFNVFTVNTPVQHGLARYMQRPASPYLDLPAFYQRKRDLFRARACRPTRGCGCCPAKAPTSRAWTTAPSAACAKPTSASG